MKSFILTLLFVLACGGEPQVGVIEQAVTNPQDGITQPWLCSGTYDPFAQSWPTHGYCTPQPRAGFVTTAVSDCIGIPTAGQVDLYLGTFFSGKCARILVPSVWDFPHVAVNGWNNVTQVSIFFIWTSIKSFELGTNSSGSHSSTLFKFAPDSPGGPGIPSTTSFFCSGHRNSAAEHKQFCGITNLGLYSSVGWSDSTRIVSFEIQQP